MIIMMINTAYVRAGESFYSQGSLEYSGWAGEGGVLSPVTPSEGVAFFGGNGKSYFFYPARYFS